MFQNNGAGIYTLFMVISSPEHSKARADIRYSLKYFMNDYNDIRSEPNDIRENELLFFIGISSDPQVQVKLLIIRIMLCVMRLAKMRKIAHRQSIMQTEIKANILQFAHLLIYFMYAFCCRLNWK